jgi:hypothetical protein
MQAMNLAIPHSQAERTEIGFGVLCLLLNLYIGAVNK